MIAAVEVRERPILFSAPMVRAILDGSKTQTRRVVTPQPRHVQMLTDGRVETSHDGGFDQDVRYIRCPYGQPGDRLWVREALRQDDFDGIWKYDADFTDLREPDDTLLAVEWAVTRQRGYYPPMHMPRWASRITLEITDVRVERVQEITEDDARAEGITDGGCLNCGESEPCGCADPQPEARDAFVWLWNQINEPRGYGWHANPWVWVVSFRRVTP